MRSFTTSAKVRLSCVIHRSRDKPKEYISSSDYALPTSERTTDAHSSHVERRALFIVINAPQEAPH